MPTTEVTLTPGASAAIQKDQVQVQPSLHGSYEQHIQESHLTVFTNIDIMNYIQYKLRKKFFDVNCISIVRILILTDDLHKWNLIGNI